MPHSRGPKLPYTLVAGVIPCRGAWLVASAKLQGVNISLDDPRTIESFVDVIDEKPAFSVIALHAPIGFLDETAPGGRTCDRAARSLLGQRRGAAVGSAPSRAALEGADEFTKLNAVTHTLLPRYREVAAEMAGHLQRTVFEVHPELSFHQLNGDQTLRFSKHSVEGREERRALLEAKIPEATRVLDADVEHASIAHLLDVTACLWTARRIFARAVIRLPEDPEWDGQGLRMELVR